MIKCFYFRIGTQRIIFYSEGRTTYRVVILRKTNGELACFTEQCKQGLLLQLLQSVVSVKITVKRFFRFFHIAKNNPA